MKDGALYALLSPRGRYFAQLLLCGRILRNRDIAGSVTQLSLALLRGALYHCDMTQAVLSLCSGLGGLDRGFAAHGYSVMSAPEKILGGDLRSFKAARGCVAGVIAGPPCQGFSKLNRCPERGALQYSLDILKHVCRIIEEARPDWFLIENVVGVPDISIEGYSVQRFNLCLSWFTENSRLRTFQFGSRNSAGKSSVTLNPMSAPSRPRKVEHTALDTSSALSVPVMLDIMGLPLDLDLSQFSISQQKRLIGNAVPVQMSRYIAGLIKEATTGKSVTDLAIDVLQPKCACACGRVTYGRNKYASNACRQRAFRARRRAS